MKLREEILKEHSKKQCLKIVAWVGNDKKRFAELIKLMLNTEGQLAQRAAWSVAWCIFEKPEFAKPWISKLIINLRKKNLHDAIKRNSVRIFEIADIPEKYCGELFEICNNYLHDLKEPIAVRAFSISVMFNIAKKYPDLINEVKHSAESLLHCGIPALEARGRNILKEIKETKK